MVGGKESAREKQISNTGTTSVAANIEKLERDTLGLFKYSFL